MFTKEQLAKWRSEGFVFDNFYDEVAVEKTEEPYIHSITIEQKKIVHNGEPQFTVVIKGNVYYNRIEVLIDGKVYEAYKDINRYDRFWNLYTTNVAVSILPVYEAMTFEIVVRVKTFDTGEIIETRTARVEANINGIARITNKPITETAIIDVMTYNVYWNTADKSYIEKIIPHTIREGYEQKIQYNYIDKNLKRHSVCLVDFHYIKKKIKGVNKGAIKPTPAAEISDNLVNEGQCERRVTYVNGDIAEYGSNEGKSFWILYECEKVDVPLVRMVDNLSYISAETVIKYTFSNSRRRYCNPLVYAAFIGALAECNFKDITSTGSSFIEGSSFPSVTHINGESIDSLYLDDSREQQFINGLYKFGFRSIYRGNDKTEFAHTEVKPRHNSHLHSGKVQVDKKSYKEIKV